MTLRVHLQSSPPMLPLTLPPRARGARIDEELPTVRVHGRDPMHRPHKPPSAMLQPRRPIRSVQPPAWPTVADLVDELGDDLLLDDLDDASASLGRIGGLERPSWCTHEGVTVVRAAHRACLRCGAVLTEG